jgi:threonine synthase
MISYVSTRQSKGEGVPFRDALLQGLAPDGGLYVPLRLPDLEPWIPRDFQDTARRVLSVWLDGVLDEHRLGDVIQDAFNFPVPLVPVRGHDRLNVLELFHGPTLSFKDFGARFLGRMLGELTSEPVTILVATSGDTGSAVADGCSGIPGVQVVLLYPKGQVSPVQERQLIAKRPGVTAVRVHGTFDDCQRLVKAAFSHAHLHGGRLTTANSINIGRLLPQMLYYIHSSLLQDEPPFFVVPSGNLGNLTAGVMAALSGMPCAGFLAAHNENDFFPRWLDDPSSRFAPSRQTLSNAMDVGAPSNFERLEWLSRISDLRKLVHGARISDRQTRETMRQIWETHGYLADPHTAVGMAAFQDHCPAGQDRTPAIVLSTAHPAKFPRIVASATGHDPDVPARLARFEHAEELVRDMDVDEEAFAELVRSTG